jgi:hypothetical protein
MSWLSLLPFIIAAASAQQCHDLCVWECDSPVCPAVCAPVCQAPLCERCYNNFTQCYPTSECWVQCADGQCEAEACPACATQCPSSLCAGEPDCHVQCREVECGWRCNTPDPSNCVYPRCELQCQQPACPAPSGGDASDAVSLLLLSTLFLLYTQ